MRGGLWLTAGLVSVEGFRIWPTVGLPSALDGILTSNYGLEQQTFDVTKQTSAATLQDVIPGLFQPTELYADAEAPAAFSIAYAHLSPAARSHSGLYSALFPVPSRPEPGNMYQYRFAMVPGEEEESTPTVSVGVGEEKGFQEGAKPKCMCLGTQGNLQIAPRALAKAGFTTSWTTTDVIDWFVEVQNEDVEAIDAYIAVNGVGFGHAFHLDFKNSPPAPTDPSDPNGNTSLSAFSEVASHLRPMVGFSEDAHKLAVVAVTFPPVSLARLTPATASYRRPSPLERHYHGRHKWFSAASDERGEKGGSASNLQHHSRVGSNRDSRDSRDTRDGRDSRDSRADSAMMKVITGRWAAAAKVLDGEPFVMEVSVSEEKREKSGRGRGADGQEINTVWVRVNTRVVNTMIFMYELDTATGEVVSKAPGISTRMMGFGERMDYEREVLNFFNDITAVKSLAGGTRLQMFSTTPFQDGTNTLDLSRPQTRKQKPASNENPFHPSY